MSESQTQQPDWARNPPRVSIIVPMRNEEKYIGACLAAIAAQDYIGDFEVLVVDGMSEDRSRAVVSRLAKIHPFIRLLENPKRSTSAAMNIGIRHATGDIVVRVDGHTILEPDYVSRCVESLQRAEVGSVGGLQQAIGQNYLGDAMALTITSPLAVGDSKYHYAQEGGRVDTVYLGAFPREIFEQVGLYNEGLVRNQDYELNYRIRQAGLAVYLDPTIRSWYLTRSTLVDFWKQYFQYGFWKIQMLRQHPASVRWRQVAPPTLVAGLLITGLLGRFYRPLATAFRLIVGAYSALAGLFTLHTARRHGWRYLPILPITFASMHLSWGLGFLWGLVRRPATLDRSTPMWYGKPRS